MCDCLAVVWWSRVGCTESARSWAGNASISVLPRWKWLGFVCCSERVHADVWLVFGLLLGVACFVLQILSVADPVDFAGA